MFYVVTISLSFIAFILYLIKWKSSTEINLELASKLPGPKGYPLLQNAPIFFNVNDPKTILMDFIEEYGSVVRFWMASSLYIVINDPDYIESLLNNSKNLRKADSYRFLHSWLGNGLITADGETWHKHRRLLTSSFHFKILEQSLSVAYNCAVTLTEQLKNELSNDEFDMHNYIEKCSMDILCETAMGVKLNVLRSNNNVYMDACKTATNISLRRMFEFFYQPEILFRFSGLYGKLKEAVKIIEVTSQKVINERKEELMEQDVQASKSKEKKKVTPFLDMLLESGLTQDEIGDEVKSFMFAGHDTTTSAISFIIWQLALHQDVQDKVYEEIENLLPENGTCPSIQDINNMKYFDQVIKECMRLCPPVPMIGRELSEDLKLSNGYVLPRGAHVNIFIYALHRNPKVYENPLEFRPERFDPENSLRSPFAYIPFSAGSRNCIGQRFALLEIKMVLSMVLRNYRVMATEKTPAIRIVTKLILRSLDGIPVKLVPRK